MSLLKLNGKFLNRQSQRDIHVGGKGEGGLPASVTVFG